MSNKLAGDELLDFARQNAHFGQSYVIEKAGYFSMRGGKLGLKIKEYTRAIQEANGIMMGPTINDRPSTRQPSYRLKSSNRNVIPVSGWYSRDMGLEPGDYVDIEPMTAPDGRDGYFISPEKVPETTGACAILA